MRIKDEINSTLESIPLDLVAQTTIQHDMTLQRSIALIGQQVPVIVHREEKPDWENAGYIGAGLGEKSCLTPSTLDGQCMGYDMKSYYRIHAGQRRISALRELGEDTVLARVYHPDLKKFASESASGECDSPTSYTTSVLSYLAKITASENLVRGANAGAEADALWSLLDGALREEVEVGDLRAAVNDISAQTGLGRTQIKTLIELRSNLTKAGLDQLRSGEISVSTAKQLGRLTIAEQTALTDAGKVKLKDIQEQIRLKRSEEQTQMFGDLPDLPTPVDQHQVLIAGIEEVIAHGGLDDLSNQTLLRAIGVLCNVPAAVVNRAVSQ